VTSLRERQKKERRNKIIEAARDLFDEHGYSKTNMDAIADRANVGVATIYSYFDNKEGVAAALTYKDASMLINEVHNIQGDLPQDPVAAVCKILAIYSRIFDCGSYGLIRLLLNKVKQSGAVSTIASSIRNQHIEQISQTLIERQLTGLISKDLDITVAANIIVDLLDRHINRMSSYPEKGANRESFNKAISVLFHNWLAQ